MAGLDVRGIFKSFGNTRVLDDVSLTIHDREFMTLVGPSGCGKSTLLRILAGLERQDSGQIAIAGETVDGIRASRRDVAMVFQSYALYPHLTVAQNIAVPLRMRRTGFHQRLPLIGGALPGAGAISRGIAEDVRRVARTLDLEHLLDRKPAQLSGGQRQRVALGRAMVRDPQVFLMDEPLSNLDAKLRVHMRAEIAQLHRRLKATFVYVTHDQAEAMTMSDRLAVMMDGRILQVDSPDRVYRDPVDLRVAEFIGSPKINVLTGAVRRDGAIDLLDRGLALPLDAATGAKVKVAIRPENVRINLTGGHLQGRVSHLENMGSDLFVHAAIDGAEQPIILRAPPTLIGALEIGKPVGCDFPLDQTLVFAEDGGRLQPRLADAGQEERRAHG